MTDNLMAVICMITSVSLLIVTCILRSRTKHEFTSNNEYAIIGLLEEAIFVLSADGRVNYVNPAAQQLIHQEMGACLGKTMGELFPGYTQEDAKIPILRKTIRFPDKSERLLSFRAVPMGNIPNVAASKMLVVGDGTELNEMSERLDYLLAHDEATGLYNATKLIQIMDEYAAAHPNGLAGTVLCSGSICNLDSMSSLLSREQRGHLDFAAASFIQSNCRPGLIVTRFGENEFCVFSNGVPIVLSELIPLLSRICTAHITMDNRTIVLEFRLGVYVVEDGVDTKMALANVTFARRVALNSTKERLKIYDKSMKLQHNLYRSLLTPSNEPNYQRDFYLEFQPILDMGRKKVLGAEAFIRWNHPSLGKIDPKVFIEVFENTGNMVSMGYTILEKVTGALASIQAALGKDFFLSINISKWQMEEGFLTRIQSVLEKHDVQAQSLVMEIKESLLKSDPADLREFAEAIRKIGIRVAVDNFSWENSSLANIVDLKCDMVKLDATFLGAARGDSEKQLIVSTMNELCGKLGVRMVVAHVETFSDLIMAEQFNFHMAQGFIFSHALPQANLIKYCIASK